VIRVGPFSFLGPRPIGVRRRTLPYMIRRPRRRGRPRSARAPRVAAVNNEVMIFDQPPAELPVATLRPRDTGAQLLLDARGWLAARWRWFRPRAIPVAAAFIGMLGVLASASYLRELAQQPPEQLPAPVLSSSHADAPVARLFVETRPPGAGTIVVTPAVDLKVEPGVYRLRIEPRPISWNEDAPFLPVRSTPK